MCACVYSPVCVRLCVRACLCVHVCMCSPVHVCARAFLPWLAQCPGGSCVQTVVCRGAAGAPGVLVGRLPAGPSFEVDLALGGMLGPPWTASVA